MCEKHVCRRISGENGMVGYTEPSCLHHVLDVSLDLCGCAELRQYCQSFQLRLQFGDGRMWQAYANAAP